MRRMLYATIWTVAVGCSDTTALRRPKDFVLVTPDVWSGGEALVMSPAFAAPAGLPLVLLDSDTLAVQRIDDTTLAARLPDLPGGHTLRVVSSDVTNTGVTINLNGFHDMSTGPVLEGTTQRWLQPTQVLGNGPTGLRLWDVYSGTTFDFPDSLQDIQCTRGVGPSNAAGRVVLFGPPGACQTPSKWFVWSLTPTATRLDSIRPATTRLAAELSPGHHFLASTHTFLLEACDTCPQATYAAENPHDVAFSPAGDQAVIIANNFQILLGAPVIDAASAQVSYVVPEMWDVEGAGFSAGGDTIYLAGLDSTQPQWRPRLVAVRAADGHPLISLTPDVQPFAVSLDQARPWLYLFGWRGASHTLALQVFDRRTLQPIATAGVPAGQSCFACGFYRILPSPLERRVYVVVTWDGDFTAGRTASLFRFDTPP